MAKSQSLGRKQTVVLEYGVAVLSVGVVALVTHLLFGFLDTIPFFYAAVILSSWYGGRGPGLLSVLLATLAVDYYLVPPVYSFDFGITDLAQMGAFAVLALIVSFLSTARKRAEGSLRQARDEMEAKVIERTADLKQTNEKLNLEISERRRMEEVQRERASLLDLTHDTIFVRDMNDVITYWNRGAEQQYGWTSEEAVGQNSHEINRTVFPAPFEEITTELTRTGRWEGELVHTRRDGTEVVVASRWALQSDEGGNPIAVLETNNDVTERKLAEEALHKAQSEVAHVTRVATLGEMTASIAHEVNQPLAAVVTNANACLRWLARETPNLAEARDAVSRIIKEGNRASDVIGRIRALVKKAPPLKHSVDINEIILEVITLSRGEVHRNLVKFGHQLSDDLPLVFADRIQLQQVILNLIMNGIEAMSGVVDRSRELHISSGRHDSNGVLVAVRDSGKGIAPESLDHLFETFFTTKPDGMGMGLAICRSIIEAHGGRLWASPNSPQGAVFQFTLPPGSEKMS
jgi:two-component system, LuxR family, sensor kinase FixL